MTERKWAKGPWVKIGAGIGCEHDSSIVAIGYGNGGGSYEANAHLIAAAPDLYEALENLLNVINGEGGTKPNARELCHKALAKARGETQ